MSTATQNKAPAPQVTEIESSIDGFFGRLIRRWKSILIMSAVIAFIWFLLMPNLVAWAPAIGFAATLLFQLLFMAFAMIFQFVVMFWFIGRPRIYWILPGETGVGFKDYRGNPEVLETASRVVTLLKGVKEFKNMGGQVTRGILLVGPPGTGKSYLGHCISTEAGVPFGYMSAPSIRGMFWGMDTMRVIALYSKARKLARQYGACILFIDEIDAIGASRAGMGGGMGMGGAMGGMMGGGGGGALNQLLTEMDPLPRDNSMKAKLKRRLGMNVGPVEIPLVLTMGATNLAQVLDPALLRPGRFDRKIFVDHPDFDGRKEIIAYYLNKVAHEDFNLDRLSSETIGQSPAAIKFIINEAVINAHFNGRSKISYEDFGVALDNHEIGIRHPVKNMLPEERRALAYHEAGHAVAQLKLLKRQRVTRVSIVRHEGGIMGFSQAKEIQESYMENRDQMLADIQVALAARAAEELFLGTQYSGVYMDFIQATQKAAVYTNLVGMSGSFYSAAAFGGGVTDPGTKKEIEKLLREQFIRVKNLLNENRELVVAIAEGLLDRLELSSDDLYQIMADVERRLIEGVDSVSVRDLGTASSVLELLPRSGATAAYKEPDKS